jgi:sugar lactone lactonase YvrE
MAPGMSARSENSGSRATARSIASCRTKGLGRSLPPDLMTPAECCSREARSGWREGVYRVTRGKVELVYPAKSFPRKLNFLNDLALGHEGTFYVSDTGDSTAAGHGAVFVLAPGKRPTILSGSDTVRAQASANGLFSGGGDSLYLVGYRTGVVSVTDGHGAWREIARGLGAPDGIDAAGDGAFYVSDNVGGDLFLVPRAPGEKPVKLASGLKSPADLVVDHRRSLLVVPENSGNRLSVYRVDSSATH